VNVNYDFESKTIKLFLEDREGLKFSVDLMEIKYNFLDQEIPDYFITKKIFSYCNSYEFSANIVNRHVLHPEFSGKAEFSRGNIKFQQKFTLKIPYFEALTALDLSFLDTSYPINKIVNIVNNEFTKNNLSISEEELLNNIK
jgi:hypothetical protein